MNTNDQSTRIPAGQACPFGDQAPFPWPRAAACPMAPPPQYAELRERDPVTSARLWDGSTCWLITRMEEFRQVLTSPHFSADPQVAGFPFISPSRAAQSRSYQTFITMDPPQHGHFRRMLTKDFMIKRVQAMRPQVQASLDGLLDEMERGGQPVDFIEKVALPLPSLVISLMLGVPYEDHDDLQTWSRDRQNLKLEPERLKQAATNMEAYISQLLRRKERDPGDGDDLLSRMAREWINPGNLSHEDAVQMGVLLYLAGHETTANLIGLGLVSLLQNPLQKDAMLADPSLVRSAAEEMLRYHSITHMNANRVATADVEIGGKLIRKGEGVLALLHAANHDPAVFDDPGRFDIHRKTDPQHVAFSYGIHQCLGQPLARLELQVVFETIFGRFPGLRLAIPYEQLQYKQDVFVFGLESLPVAW
jgi:cytochrome P450